MKIIRGEPKRTGVIEIERELDALEASENFVSDLKIYDYLNLLKPSVGTNDDHLGQTQIVWDLQTVSKKKDKEAVVVTASQANMEGAGVDKDGKPVKLRADNQGKSIGISQGVDNSIGINIELGQTDQLGVMQPPQIILSILFMRDGAIREPEIRLVSEIDRMCLDRGMRDLWSEAKEFDGVERMPPPGF